MTKGKKTQWEKNFLWYEHIEVDDDYCSLRLVSEDVAIVIVDAAVFVIRHCKCMGGSTKQCLMHYVQWWDILMLSGYAFEQDAVQDECHEGYFKKKV